MIKKLLIGGTIILTTANAASGGTLTPFQVTLIDGTSGAVIEGGSEILDELHDGEPINWGAVAARTVGGGAKGAMFSVPGLGTAKLAAGTVGIATAENYLHSAAKGDVSAEALGKALANGTIEGVTAGLVDVAAKKVLGAQTHAEPKPKPELQIEPMTEAERRSYLKPDIQLFAKKADPILKNIHGEERNIRVHSGRQSKHIPKQNNYENAVRQGKTPSVFYGTVEDAQELVNEFAGTGKIILKNPNRERVNFGRVIGIYVDDTTNKSVETACGIIRYSKDGVHIVPSKPEVY